MAEVARNEVKPSKFGRFCFKKWLYGQSTNCFSFYFYESDISFSVSFNGIKYYTVTVWTAFHDMKKYKTALTQYTCEVFPTSCNIGKVIVYKSDSQTNIIQFLVK